jgi:tRNA nucleotidyltransferase (CCA-adding enzyme)
MQTEMDRVFKTVLARVTPKKSERAKIEALAKKLKKRVVSTSKALDIEAQVRIEGSVAKDTWLSDEPEIDIFMRVQKTIPRKSLGEVCLKIARKATRGSKQIENFAEHPYLEAIVDDVTVNIVPCYSTEQGEWLSATDRTPFHTDYVKRHLGNNKRNDVRLLKRFMKGIGVYGAEIKIGGFSGYLCELLILQYTSFVGTLKAFARHKQRVVVDIKHCYEDRERELQLLFPEPLVVVDPVDKGRNVASAVQGQQLFTFVAASRAFLKKPSLDFFYPPETTALGTKEIGEALEKRGPTIIFVTFGKVDAVPDILWGQLYKSQRSLRKLVQLSDFKILRDLPWSDEETINMFVFELEHCCLPPVKKHLGPPVEKEQESQNFVTKHLNNRGTVAGPYIEDGRWVVQITRKYTDACDLLGDKLKNGGRSAGIGEMISEKLHKGFRIYINSEIVGIYAKNGEFAKFLTEFLSGKPKWLTST